MKCPHCSNRLVEVTSRAVLVDAANPPPTFVDICLRCKGIWFDWGEFLDFVMAFMHDDPSPFNALPPPGQMVQSISGVAEETHPCPRCRQELLKSAFYDRDVLIDQCPLCRGVWADRDAIKALAQHFRSKLQEVPTTRELAEAVYEHVKKLQYWKEVAALGEALTAQPRIPVPLLSPLLGLFVVLPFSDSPPRERFPLVTVSLILGNVVIFVSQLVLVHNLYDFFQRYGFIPAHVTSLGLFSSQFLHGGVLHLLGNMFFLWLFGDNVEDRFSRLGFLAFYLSCGLAANLMYWLSNANSFIPAVGASGAISGILGAYFVLYPSAWIKVFAIDRIVRMPALLYLGAWFAWQLLVGLLTYSDTATGIAWWAHIGGFVFGGLVAYVLKRRPPSIHAVLK